jgi:iron complex outermembrane receptor protein
MFNRKTLVVALGGVLASGLFVSPAWSADNASADGSTEKTDSGAVW